jgi:hypothetical protein
MEIDAAALCSIGLVLAFITFLALRHKARTGKHQDLYSQRSRPIYVCSRLQARPRNTTTTRTTLIRSKVANRQLVSAGVANSSNHRLW